MMDGEMLYRIMSFPLVPLAARLGRWGGKLGEEL